MIQWFKEERIFRKGGNVMLNEVKNREFIDIYRDYMEEKKLGPREIKKHLSCVSAYVVFFLGHQLDKPIKD